MVKQAQQQIQRIINKQKYFIDIECWVDKIKIVMCKNNQEQSFQFMLTLQQKQKDDFFKIFQKMEHIELFFRNRFNSQKQIFKVFDNYIKISLQLQQISKKRVIHLYKRIQTQLSKDDLVAKIKYLQNSLNMIKRTINLYHFSNSFKAKPIEILNHSLARQTSYLKNNQQRIVLIQPPLSLNQISSVKLRVKNIQRWIGIGLCFKDIMVNKKYLFSGGIQIQLDEVTNGAFLVTSSKVLYIHGKYGKRIDFQFKSKQTLQLEFNPTGSFLKISNMQKHMKQSIKIQSKIKSFYQQNNIYFCVCLLFNGDQIEIVKQ